MNIDFLEFIKWALHFLTTFRLFGLFCGRLSFYWFVDSFTGQILSRSRPEGKADGTLLLFPFFSHEAIPLTWTAYPSFFRG